jgi:hypothetical protein
MRDTDSTSGRQQDGSIAVFFTPEAFDLYFEDWGTATSPEGRADLSHFLVEDVTPALEGTLAAGDLDGAVRVVVAAHITIQEGHGQPLPVKDPPQ